MSSLPLRMALAFGLLFCAALLSLELVQLYGLPGTAMTGSMEEQRQGAVLTLGRLADFKKEQLARWLGERRANTRLMAANQTVFTGLRAARAALAGGAPDLAVEQVRPRLSALPELQAARRYMENVRNSYQVFSSIMLVDSGSGRVLVSTPGGESIGQDVSADPLVMRASEAGQKEVITQGEAMGTMPAMSMVRQIHETSADGETRLLGLMIFRFSLKPVLMSAGAGDAQLLGQTGQVAVFGPDDALLARTSGENAGGGGVPRVPPALPRLAVEGNEGASRTLGRHGKPIIAVYRHIHISPELGWGLVVNQDEEEILAPINRDSMRRLGFGAVLLGLVLVMTGLLSKLVSNPVRSLSLAAQRVEKGDFSARAEVSGGGELAMLACTFNAMVESMGQMHGGLERLVDERTRALQAEFASRAQAEAHVRELLNEKAALLDNTMVGIYTTEDRILTACNRHLQTLVGYAPEEMLGQSVEKLYHSPQAYEAAGPRIYGGLAERGYTECDLHLRRKDGTSFWAYISGRPLDMNHPDGAIVWMMTDITARKAAEEALMASEERYRHLIQGTNAVFTLVDTEGRFLFVNDVAAAIFGVPAEDCPGRSTMDFVHPDDREATATAFARWLESGAENVEFENRQLSVDGRVSHLAWTIRIHRDDEGRPIHLTSVARDTTELRKAQTALRLTQFSVDNAGEAICWMDEAMTVLYANAAAHYLLEREPGPIEGAALSTLVGEDYVPQWYGAYDILAPGNAMTFETHVRDARGRAITVEVTASKLIFDDRERRCAFFRDISVRKEAEERLVRTNVELEQFAFITSHDLREPLRTINIYLELVSRRLADHLDGDSRDFIGFVRDAASRMDNLVNDLLEYSRTGRTVAPPATVDLLEVIALVRAHLMGPLGECGGTIELPEMLPSLVGDEGDFVRLFQNLIGNAIKYRSPDRPLRIAIHAHRQEGVWRFCVADNGIGIEPEYREKIFRVFQRLHPSGAFGGGTGIGLAICKKLVEQRGGQIWVEPAPGQGSAFFFTIPDLGSAPPPHA